MKACCRVLTSAIWSYTEINRSYAEDRFLLLFRSLCLCIVHLKTVWVWRRCFFEDLLSSWCWVVSFCNHCHCVEIVAGCWEITGHWHAKGFCLTFIKGGMMGEWGMEGRRKALECDTGKMCLCWGVELFPLAHPYGHNPPSSHGHAFALTSAVSWGSVGHSSKGLILV